MKIIIVGLGKVGTTLAQALCDEENDITVIDRKEELVEEFCGQLDIMGVVGNGASHSVQEEAGIEDADLLIAVTGSDELNLLCCLIAKEAGNCQTICRVRNPEYSSELHYLRDKLGLALIINPDAAAAGEIARNLKFPSAIEVDSFAKGHVDLLKFRVREDSLLDGMRIADIAMRLKVEVLICAIERGKEVIIPNGNTVLQAKDKISFIGTMQAVNQLFKKIGIPSNQVKNIMIVGGSPMAYYLAKLLEPVGIRVKIVERDWKRCEDLSELLPKATLICGDGTDKALLIKEGLERAESFAALTNVDEENILISLYAKKFGGQKKIVTKINRIAFDEVIQELDLDTIVHSKDIASERIIRHVRSMKNSHGSNMETLHKIIDGKAEAMEFILRDHSALTQRSLQELSIRKGILVACIYRAGKIIIPRGSDRMQPMDRVIIITQEKGLENIEDILE